MFLLNTKLLNTRSELLIFFWTIIGSNLSEEKRESKLHKQNINMSVAHRRSLHTHLPTSYATLVYFRVRVILLPVLRACLVGVS